MFTVEKELKEQKSTLESVYKFIEDLFKEDVPNFLFNSDIAYFSGCGTSYYIAILLSRYFTLETGIESKALPAGEIHSAFKENLGKNSLKKVGIFISRSGDSTDTILACNKFKENRFSTISVTMNENSPLNKLSDVSIILPIKEEGIVMTKSFTSMILSFQMMVDKYLGRETKNYFVTFNKLDNIIEKLELIIEEKKLYSFKHFVFLGLGMYEGLARESALKLEEMSLSYTEAFSTYEYRHGPKSLADSKTLVCIFGENKEAELDLENEISKYGSTVINIGRIFDGFDIFGYNFAFLQILFAQVLGLKIALSKNINVDRPRNLDKVVKF